MVTNARVNTETVLTVEDLRTYFNIRLNVILRKLGATNFVFKPGIEMP